MATINDFFHFGQFALLLAGAVIPLIPLAYFFLAGMKAVVLASFASAVLAIAAHSGVRTWRRRRVALDSDWNPDLWIRKRISSALIQNDKEATYNQQLELISLRHHVNQFHFRVGWTGSGELSVVVKNQGFRRELSDAPFDTAHILTITFNRPLHKGEKLNLEFDLITEGTERHQEPFYSVTNFESRLPQETTVRVEFAPGVDVRSIRKEIYASDTSAWPVHPPEQASLDRDRCVAWIVPRVPGRRFGFRWELG